MIQIHQCYVMINVFGNKGSRVQRSSLVYHAGFPVATIEAYEKLLKKKAMESMKGEPNINPEKANETFYVEWDNGKGFFETEDMDEAKDKAKDNDGKVILVEDGMQDEQVYPAEDQKQVKY